MKKTLTVALALALLAIGCKSPERVPTFTAEQIRASLQNEKSQGAIAQERDKSGRFYSQKMTIGINSNREERAVRDISFELDFGSESGLTGMDNASLQVNKSEQLIIDDGTGNPIIMAVPVGFSLGVGSIGSASLSHVPAETEARASLASARGQSGAEVIGAIYKGYVEFVNAAGEINIKRTSIVAGMVTSIVDKAGTVVQGVLQPITTVVKQGLEVVSDVAVRKDNGSIAVGKLME